MKKWSFSKNFFIQNRINLAKQLLPNSLAILNSNDLLPTNADGTYPFIQNTDLFYLTGINQEETLLLLYPDHPDEKFREILFITETNPQIETWHGKKLNKDEAKELSGIESVYWTNELDSILNSLVLRSENIYINLNEHSRASIEIQSRDYRFFIDLKSKYPLHNYKRLAPLIYNLRMIKSSEEIEKLNVAIDITEKGFRRVLSYLKPGVWEYEVEAEFAYEFIKNGARFAYNPIIASGAGACVLHYEKNDEICRDGDLLLLDVGASFAYYNADMTRTIPINGKFTSRQKEVYKSVLKVMKDTINEMKPGKKLKEIQQFTENAIGEQLLNLGLINKQEYNDNDKRKQIIKKYFPHGVSHFLGLDVHDVGELNPTLKSGMVFTCEPGIYIKEEGIGIRLENDILITDDGNIDLMAKIPIEPEEIEDLMNKK
ncbi:MAG: aminopeptidase P family protein [Spirochaetota bacterium]